MSHQGYYTESASVDNVNELLNEAELYRDQSLQYSLDSAVSADLSSDYKDQSEAAALDAQSQASAAAISAAAAFASEGNAQSSSASAEASAIQATEAQGVTIGYRDQAEEARDDAQAAQAAAELAEANAGQAVVDAAGVLVSAALKANNLRDLTSADAALTNLGISTFSKGLLDDATSGEALTTLGVSGFMQTTLDDADAATFRVTTGTNSATNLTTGTLDDARISASGPTTPTFANSFSDGGGTRYWKVAGVVYVAINVARATTPAVSTTMFTLPPGFCPPVGLRSIGPAAQSSPLSLGSAYLEVTTGGVVRNLAYLGPAPGGTNYAFQALLAFPAA